MTCSRCGGDMEARNVNFCACNLARPVMVREVPAHVCVRCGGEVFSDEAADVFERIREGATPPPIMLAMKVYDYDAVRDFVPVKRAKSEMKQVLNQRSTIAGIQVVATFQIGLPDLRGGMSIYHGGTAGMSDLVSSQRASS